MTKPSLRRPTKACPTTTLCSVMIGLWAWLAAPLAEAQPLYVESYVGTGVWQSGTPDPAINPLLGALALTFDRGGTLSVADARRVLKIQPTGAISVLAGSHLSGFVDRVGAAAQFGTLFGIAVADDGTVYVADTTYHRIRKITPAGVVSTFAGSGEAGYADGTGGNAKFNRPFGLAIDREGYLYVGDSRNHRIRKVSPQGAVITLAGSGTQGHVDGFGPFARLTSPGALALDAQGNIFAGSDHAGNGATFCIRQISPDGDVSTLAGSPTDSGSVDGVGAAARFSVPGGLAFDAQGNLLVLDYGNKRLRRVTPAGAVSTVVGTGQAGFAGGPAALAQFGSPIGLTVDANGFCYVAESTGRISQVRGLRAGSGELLVEHPEWTLTHPSETRTMGNVYLQKQSTPLPVVLRNLGTEPLTGLTATLEGTHPGDFLVVEPPPTTLAPESKVDLAIVFAPTAAGLRSAPYACPAATRPCPPARSTSPARASTFPRLPSSSRWAQCSPAGPRKSFPA